MVTAAAWRRAATATSVISIASGDWNVLGNGDFWDRPLLGIKHILSARGVSLKMRYSSQDLLEIRWILGADILNGILWGAPIFFWDSRFQLMVLRAEFYGDLTHFLGCWHVRGKVVSWWAQAGGMVERWQGVSWWFSVAAFHFFNN